MSISILMSVYYKDNSDFFNQALASIWDQQTYKPNEIILVADGQLTNELLQVINIWQKKLGSVLKFIQLEKNYGLAYALNIGINSCTSELIARMDADDISTPDRLELQQYFLANNPDIAVVGGFIQEFEKEFDKPIFFRKFPLHNNEIKKFIIKAIPMQHGTMMFRKKVFDNGIRYNNKYKTTQDLDLIFKLIKNNYLLANIPNVIYKIRVSPDFYKRRSKAKAINEFKIYWKGIIDLYGFKWYLIYPVTRVIMRFTPSFIVKMAYNSKIRKKLLS